MAKIKDKKAQFFGIYLVLLTLFMCFIVAGMYFLQNINISNSIASPALLLSLQDRQELFELREEILIKNSLKESNNDADKAHNIFCNNLIESDEKSFLFENLIIDNVLVDFSDKSSQKRFCMSKDVYEFNYNEKWVVQRKQLKKYFLAKAPDRAKINFAADVDYLFEKKYEILESDL